MICTCFDWSSRPSQWRGDLIDKYQDKSWRDSTELRAKALSRCSKSSGSKTAWIRVTSTLCPMKNRTSIWTHCISSARVQLMVNSCQWRRIKSTSPWSLWISARSNSSPTNHSFRTFPAKVTSRWVTSSRCEDESRRKMSLNEREQSE